MPSRNFPYWNKIQMHLHWTYLPPPWVKVLLSLPPNDIGTQQHIKWKHNESKHKLWKLQGWGIWNSGGSTVHTQQHLRRWNVPEGDLTRPGNKGYTLDTTRNRNLYPWNLSTPVMMIDQVRYRPGRRAGGDLLASGMTVTMISVGMSEGHVQYLCVKTSHQLCLLEACMCADWIFQIISFSSVHTCFTECHKKKNDIINYRGISECFIKMY